MNKFELQTRSLFYKKFAKPHSDSTFTPLFFCKKFDADQYFEIINL